MINILFIAFEFPPLVRGGVYRPLAFTQHLPDYDINPIVITLDKGSYSHTFDIYGVDDELGQQVIANRAVLPVPADKAAPPSKLKNFFSIYFSVLGNDVKYWKKNFYSAIGEAVEKYSPKAILVTVPPFGALELAEQVARKYDLPLISDFRDAFSQWRGVPYGSFWHYFKTLQAERRFLKASDAVIATSKQTLDDFKKIHPGLAPHNFYYIPNGYSGALGQWKPIDPAKEEFVIGYVGSFYYSPQARKQMFQPWWKKSGHRKLQYIPVKQDWLYRSPYFFFKALQQLNVTHSDLGRKIKIKFAGRKPLWLMDMIKSFDLQDKVTLIGEIPHSKSLKFQQECDALLITSAKRLGGRDYSIAGKTYEYLQMQRPVIAFVCEGAQKDLLDESGTALICDPDNSTRSAIQLMDLFEGRVRFTPDYVFLEKLTRKQLTSQLAELIVKTIDRRQANP